MTISYNCWSIFYKLFEIHRHTKTRINRRCSDDVTLWPQKKRRLRLASTHCKRVSTVLAFTKRVIWNWKAAEPEWKYIRSANKHRALSALKYASPHASLWVMLFFRRFNKSKLKRNVYCAQMEIGLLYPGAAQSRQNHAHAPWSPSSDHYVVSTLHVHISMAYFRSRRRIHKTLSCSLSLSVSLSHRDTRIQLY